MPNKSFVVVVSNMKKKKIIALSSFIIAGLLILQFTGDFVVQKVYAGQTGSTIAGISVEALSEEEIRNTLQQEIAHWTSEQMIVVGGGAELALNTSQFQFDIDSTMNLYQTMTKKPWYAFWKDEPTVNLPLELAPNEVINNELAAVAIWDTENTYDRVMQHAANLNMNEVEAEVVNVEIIENERIALGVEKIPEDSMGTIELTEALNNQIILPNQPFSFLETVGEQINLANRSAANFVASMVYNVALQSNSEILERTAQKQEPSYLKPGFEAEVNALTSQDLRFVNQTANMMKLSVTIEGENLVVGMYAPVKEDEITVRSVLDGEVAPRIITRYSKDLAIGEQQLIKEGEPGLRVSVYRMSAQTGEETLISKDYYAPENRIILKSAHQPEQVQTGNTNTMNKDAGYIDLDGNGLIDFENMTDQEIIEQEKKNEAENLPAGSYYDKGGNLIQQGGN